MIICNNQIWKLDITMRHLKLMQNISNFQGRSPNLNLDLMSIVFRTDEKVAKINASFHKYVVLLEGIVYDRDSYANLHKV
jgi:cytochrome b involved in lipid metabolism